MLAADPTSIDFTQVIIGLDGKPLLQGDPKTPISMTLSDVAMNALETMIEEDKQMSGSDKYKQDELAHKFYMNKRAVLTVEEIALIKTRIGKLYSPLIVGASWRLLDPALHEKTAAK